jgi:hypothetical protein
MEKNIITIFGLALCLGGCFPETFEPTCEQQQEAEKVGLAYEELFDEELTDEQWECLHNFEIAYGTDEEVAAFCETDSASGCYKKTPLRARGPVIMISTELPEGTAGEIGVLHHEMIHLLLDCVNGDSDHDHEGREWFPAGEYSGWDMSIINYANTMEATVYVCE